MIALLSPSTNTILLGKSGKDKALEEEHANSTVWQQCTTTMISPPQSSFTFWVVQEIQSLTRLRTGFLCKSSDSRGTYRVSV